MAARILLFTGKGGVGKTTTAAATAVACADEGLRTLVLSTDPAHSLADALDHPLGDEPAQVVTGDGASSLWGQQLDARARLEASWADVRGWLADVFRWAGLASIDAEELAVLPGLDELFALADVRAHATGGAYDVVVVDCAPTADTLRLLSLPALVGWWSQRLFPLGRQVTSMLGPMVRAVTDVPVAGAPVFDAVEGLLQRLDGVGALLADPAVTSARLVVTPERVVVAEARRLAAALALHGVRVDAVVANRVVPPDADGRFAAGMRAAQHAPLLEVEDGFAPVPVLHAPLRPDEPVGVHRLREVAAAVYAHLPPAAVLLDTPVLRIDADGDDLVLRIDLPFTDRSDLRLARRPGELVVTLGPHRRAVLLPDALRARRVTDAALRDGILSVRFSR